MLDTITSRLKPAGLWRNPDFIKLWAGQTISEFGSRITRDGLPLLAVLTLGATPFEMGILTAAGSLPVLLFSLAAGVWVDRLRRRPVLIVADFARAFLLLLIPLAALTGRLRIEHLYVIAGLVGFFTILFNVAYQAFLPFLVERKHLIEGNSKLAFSSSLAELGGPELAGILIQLLTAPLAILINSLTFLASVASIVLIRKPEPLPTPPEDRRPALVELREGLHLVLNNRILRALALAAGSRQFFGAFFGVLYSLFAVRELDLGPIALGFTIAAGGAGDLLGALLAAPAVRRFGLGPTMLTAWAISSLALLLVPLAGGTMVVILTMMMAAQVFGDGMRSVYDINEVSLRQSVTPDRLLGRVNASVQLLVAGIAPLGALVGGWLGTAAGVRPTLLIAIAGILVSGLWLIFSPVPKLAEYPEIES